MKIAFKLAYEGKEYDYLSDNTKDCAPDTLFVETPRNGEFAKELRAQGVSVLHYSELKGYFTFPPKIIGITGTNGKTTTANLIYSTLLRLGYSCAMLDTQGLYHNGEQLRKKGLTTPTILELYENLDLLKKRGCEVLVMEVSSHAIEQQRIYGLEFCAKVLTNITSDHLDYHGDIETYRAIKNSFLEDSAPKVINLDEPNARFNPKNSLLYSISEAANLRVESYSLERGICAELSYEGAHYRLESKLYGLHNLYNILAALGCLRLVSGLDMGVLVENIRDFGGVSGRMEVVSDEPLVIVDFAHTHDGMEKIFESFVGREVAVVFGAGGDRDRSKRPLMGSVAEKYAKRIFLTSDNPRSEEPMGIMQDILAGIEQREKVIVEIDRKQAIHRAIDSLPAGGVLLILGKGDETSQIFKDRVVEFDDREVVREYLRGK